MFYTQCGVCSLDGYESWEENEELTTGEEKMRRKQATGAGKELKCKSKLPQNETGFKDNLLTRPPSLLNTWNRSK